jgi:hypothetical protein
VCVADNLGLGWLCNRAATLGRSDSATFLIAPIFRYTLRTLLILLAVGPALIAVAYWERKKYDLAVTLQRVDLWADFQLDVICLVGLSVIVAFGYLLLVYMDREGSSISDPPPKD